MILGALRIVLSCQKCLNTVFEYCLLDRFKYYFVSADNQFGFKKVFGAVLQSAQYVILLTVML